MHHGTGSKLAAFAALGLLASVSGVAAQEVVGTWERDTGASRVRFTKCGDALCGSLSWLKDEKGPAKVGQRIFYDMKPDGSDAWKGSAFNPEDGKTYAGKMSLSGNTLTTAGCAMGGMICKSTTWTKAN